MIADFTKAELQKLRFWATQNWPLAQVQVQIKRELGRDYTISGVSRLLKRVRALMSDDQFALSAKEIVASAKPAAVEDSDIEKIRARNRDILKRVQSLAETDLNPRHMDMLVKISSIVNRDEESRRAEIALKGAPMAANSLVELFDEIQRNDVTDTKESKSE